MTQILNKALRPIFSFVFKWLYPIFPYHRKILWFFSRHYFVKGKKECGAAIAGLTKKGYGVLLNYCTEDACCRTDIADAFGVYLQLIYLASKFNGPGRRIALSLKLSQFGCLGQDAEFGMKVFESIVGYAAERRIRVVLDGERLRHAEAILAIGQTMNEKYGNMKVRLQAYNPKFCDLLLSAVAEDGGRSRPVPLGICKGAYHEKSAFRVRETIENFMRGVVCSARCSHPVSIDTNDENLIKKLLSMRFEDAEKPQLSFGLLYNVKPWLARKLKDSGSVVSIYLPVIDYNDTQSGKQWEQFALRRLIERPVYIFLPFKLFVDRLLGRESY